MKIYNSKTNVEFSTRTIKQTDGFVACVVQGEYKLGHIVKQKLVKRVEGFPTRGKASRYAEKQCRTFAENHAFIN
jgi:hypothetical protein